MTRLLSFALALAGLISCAGCSNEPAQNSNAPSPANKNASQNQGADGAASRPTTTPSAGIQTPANPGSESSRESSELAWKPFTPPEGGYSVLLPGTAKSIPADEPSVENYAVELPTGFVCLVSKSQRPTPITDPVKGLAALRDAQAGGNKVLFDNEISVEGKNGREFGYVDQDGDVCRVRVFIDGNTVYQLIAVKPKAKYSEDDPETLKFFESFKFVDAASSAEKN